MRAISREAARQFVLRHQGLLGAHRFHGKAGVLAFARQAGCVQFDPVNVCGISPEITWLSRVLGYEKAQSDQLLYEERALIDHFDKNLAIFPREDWPYFKRLRLKIADYGASQEEIKSKRMAVLDTIRERGPQSAGSLKLAGKIDGFWGSSTSLSRATLEHLYYEGSLLIHSKKGLIKTYDLAQRCLGEDLFTMEEPLQDDAAHDAWHLRRRVSALSLLWPKASNAFLGSTLMSTQRRRAAFDALEKKGELLAVSVSGIKEPLYLLRQDEPLLSDTLEAKEYEKRCELIAPLDSLLWDRKLTQALFDFNYTWEIYTPAHKRVYGAYVLPVLYGERFIARVEPVCDRKAKTMSLRGLWWEEGYKPTSESKKALSKALEKLAKYNGCVFMGEMESAGYSSIKGPQGV